MTPTSDSLCPALLKRLIGARPVPPSPSQGRGGRVSSHLSLGISTRGDPRNPRFLVSHLLVRFPHRKHVNDLSSALRTRAARLSHKASKKPLNSGRSPREPKSDAKLQPLSDMAKYFHKKMKKKRRFNILSQKKGKNGEKSGKRRLRNSRI